MTLPISSIDPTKKSTCVLARRIPNESSLARTRPGGVRQSCTSIQGLKSGYCIALILCVDEGFNDTAGQSVAADTAVPGNIHPKEITGKIEDRSTAFVCL